MEDDVSDQPGSNGISRTLREIASQGAKVLRETGLDPRGELGSHLSAGVERLSGAIEAVEAQLRRDVEAASHLSSTLEEQLAAAWEKMQQQAQSGNPAAFRFDEVFGESFGAQFQETFRGLFAASRPDPKKAADEALTDQASLRISYRVLGRTAPLTRDEALAVVRAASEGLQDAAVMLGRVTTTRTQMDLDEPVVTVNYDISGEAASMTAGMLAMVGFSGGELQGLGKVRATVELG